MKLSSLVHNLDSVEAFNFRDVEISAITSDSRKVKPDYLFVAIKGYKTNGHDFIEKALECGAIVIVSEKKYCLDSEIPQIIVRDSREALSNLSSSFYGNPSQKISVIGITGTNGKTTTTFITKSIIESAGNQTGLIGTINYQIGQRIEPAKETTPESTVIQGAIAEMVALNIKFVVMEVSSHALIQHRIKDICFKTAVFTNLSAEHLDYHGTISNYACAKSRLFEYLKKDSFAVLNADDAFSKGFADKTKARILWFGIENDADIQAEICSESMHNTMIRIKYSGKTVDVNMPLIGRHNVYNALASAASALSLGFGLETIKEGIETVETVPGRLQRIPCKRGFSIFIDYAHTPHALETVLCTLRNLSKGRLILVFGCGGDRDREKRPKMGKIADENSDIFWVTNDNPRSEDPLSIVNDIKSGVKSGRPVYIQTDRHKAIEEAINEAKKNDIVLIAGKGHEKYQIVKETMVPFDDEEVVKEILSDDL